MNKQPSYYAILTADVRYDERLSSSEKLFYAEVTALSNKTGQCWASNKYFADLYGVSKSTVSGWVRKLCECGYVDVDYQYDGKQIEKRFISIKDSSGVHLFEQGCSENQKGGVQNIEQGCSENLKDNSTSINTTSKNSIYPFDAFWDDYDHKKERKKCERKWKKLSEDERETIKEFVPIYLAHTPDKNYRKYPSTFLNNEIWNDDWDSYKPKTNTNGTTKQNRAQRYIDRAQGVLSQLPE